jgi:hypothetical protein
MNRLMWFLIFIANLWVIDSALAVCDTEFASYANSNKLGGQGRADAFSRHKRIEEFGFLNIQTGYSASKDEIRKYLNAEIPLYIKHSLRFGNDPDQDSKVTSLRYDLCMLESTPVGSKQGTSGQPVNSNQPQQNQSAEQQKGSDFQANGPQQSAQQAQQLAKQNQARADQARQGKRRRHEPENEASQCIQPDFGGLYGGMKNTCNFKVWYTYCGYRPKENSWLTGMNCEKQSFGSDSVGPGRTSAAHTKGVEMLYWIACKEPAWTVDTEFVPGQGLRGRCHTVGGN